MTGHALRYVWWQVRDRTVPRLAVCLVIAALMALPAYLGMRDRHVPADLASQMVASAHGQAALIFSFIMAGGIIAQDRMQGWYRFYLAKPVSPAWFYGQSIALTWLGMLAASAGFLLLFSSILDVPWSWRSFRQGAITFALIGMLVVAWSSIIRRDWIAALGTFFVIALLRDVADNRSGILWSALSAILAPFGLINSQRALSAGDVAGIVAWSLGLFALALVTLRRRPLGED
jgi:hypothetical protein